MTRDEWIRGSGDRLVKGDDRRQQRRVLYGPDLSGFVQ
jgi:hypothetical protein